MFPVIKFLKVFTFWFFLSSILISLKCYSQSYKTNELLIKSKNKSISIENRILFLKEAFSLNENEINDSIRNSLNLDIAYQSFSLKDTSFFKKVNTIAFHYSEKTMDILGLARSHYFFGLYYLKLEERNNAFYHFNLAKDNYDKLDLENMVGSMYYNMSLIQKDVKDYSGSEITIFKAIPIFKKLDKNENLFYSYNLLGVIYKNLNEFEKAIVYHKKALEYAENFEDKFRLKKISLNNLGVSYRAKGDYIKSIEYFESVLEIKRFINIKDYARVLDNLNYTKFLSGDSSSVLQNLNLALYIRDSMDFKSGIIISKLHLAEYHTKYNDTAKAITYAKEVGHLAKTVNDNRDRLAALKLLASIDFKNSNTYLSEYIALSDSLVTQERQIRNKFTRIQFETDEYIEETEKLTDQKARILIIGGTFIFILGLLYIIKVQRSKNNTLAFERKQQKANEEIYDLMLRQQGEIEETRQKERNRISKELHDGIIGNIFGTRLTFGFLDFKGSKEDKEKFNGLIKELQYVEKDIREVSHQLSQDISMTQNFESIIKVLVDKHSDIGGFMYKLDIDSNIKWSKIEGVVKINIYRVLQEVLQNCHKHANANMVNIQFANIQNQLEFRFEDNGQGFDTTKIKKGIGLKNIQSRVKDLNGTSTINSKINVGTTIVVNIPINITTLNLS